MKLIDPKGGLFEQTDNSRTIAAKEYTKKQEELKERCPLCTGSEVHAMCCDNHYKEFYAYIITPECWEAFLEYRKPKEEKND